MCLDSIIQPQIHPSLLCFTAERVCFLPGCKAHAQGTLVPLEAPLAFRPTPARTHPQTFNLVSNKISQPHYTSQAHHLHLNEWPINKVNSLQHRVAMSLVWKTLVAFLGRASIQI